MRRLLVVAVLAVVAGGGGAAAATVLTGGDEIPVTSSPGDEGAPPTTGGSVVEAGGDREPSTTTVPPSTTTPSTDPDPAPPTTTPPTTTPTTPTTPTTAPEPPATGDGSEGGSPQGPQRPAVLRPGDEGPEVRALQERLASLGYWIGGSADGVYGSTTAQAVMAFQKVTGLDRDGLAGPATREALARAERPQARSGAGSGRLVEIDLERQVLFVVRDGEVVEVFNTSTGARGWRTPPGRFQVERHIDGIRHAPLGDLYRPKYFNGGIAVHGSPSIPGHPASHGCARVHDRAMDHLWATGALAIGTPVWVY